MTQSEIQKYSVKCAELMGGKYSQAVQGDISTLAWQFPKSFNVDESINIYDEDLKFHTSYEWQIKVWQKAYHQFRVNVVKKLISEPKYFLELREEYFKTLDIGTPLDSFIILCKCIDLIEKGEGK